MPTLLLLLIGVVLLALIIAANGYFVAQEFAYMSVDRATLRTDAERGDAAAARALKVTRRTSFMLSGAQLGITVTGLLVGYVAGPYIGTPIGDLFAGSSVSPVAAAGAATTITLIVATVVQMIFAELYPKNLAIAAPGPMARALARSTVIYLAIFGWLITFFDKSSDALLRLLRVEPVHDVDSSASATDLEHMIDDSRASGDLPEELSLMLDRILDFPNRDVEHAMIPRSRVGSVRTDTTIAQTRARMAQEHTRYPVIGENDEPVGTVHMVDVLETAPDDARPVESIMRELYVIAESQPLGDALQELARSKNELACVIDEYGSFVGVITIEDFAEELVGEITDEHDTSDGTQASTEADGVWTVDGGLHVDEAERLLGRDLPKGDYETIAGFAIEHAGKLPEVGDTVSIELPEEGEDFVTDTPVRRTLIAEVVEIDRHIPSTLRIQVLETEVDDSDDRDDSGHDDEPEAAVEAEATTEAADGVTDAETADHVDAHTADAHTAKKERA